jgi:hypothetical protein
MSFNTLNTFTITSQPYYNECLQQYQNILCTNIEPKGPLRHFVRRLRMPNLYRNVYSNRQYRECCLALVNFLHIGGVYPYRSISYTNNQCCGYNELMSPDEIPGLVSFLLANGYQIETQITNVLSRLTNSQVSITVTYYGDKPVSIVYQR